MNQENLTTSKTPSIEQVTTAITQFKSALAGKTPYAVRIHASADLIAELRSNVSVSRPDSPKSVLSHIFGLPIEEHFAIGGSTLGLIEMSDGSYHRISKED